MIIEPNRIRSFMSYLQHNNVCNEIWPVENAITSYKKTKVLNVQKLKFRFKTRDFRNLRVNTEYVTAELSVTACNIDDISTSLFIQFLQKYSFHLVLTAQDMSSDDDRQFKDSWHIDYDSQQNARFVHPIPHLSYGGTAIDNLDKGELLLHLSPRWSTLPMDLILSIDFLLSNFLVKDKYIELSKPKEYSSIVENSQRNLWRPYLHSLSSHWHDYDYSHYQTADAINKVFIPTLR